MKILFKSFLVLLIAIGFLNATAIEQNGSKDGYEIKLITKKSLVVGNNDFLIELLKDKKIVNDAKVKIKFFMPEMPGMPYMEYEDKAVLEDGKYKVMINFSMGGTWQYQLKFKTSDDEVHMVRGSVNI